MKNRILLKIIVLTSLIQGLLINQALAEELELFQENQANHPLEIPERGQSHTEVAMAFGEPQRATSLAGKLPIRTWHYEEFSVYFEEDRVIHAVRRNRRL